MQQVKAVVARTKGGRSQSRRSTCRTPGPGETLVKVQACGVCHTDEHHREGGINDDFAFLLGHEAAGMVESVGEGVTDVEPGDVVVRNRRAVCGSCRACLRGEPWYCFATHNATQRIILADGTQLSPALGIGSFAEKTALKSSWYGDCLPSRDFPMLVDLYQQGRVDLDAFASEEIGLGDAEAALEKTHRGEVLRSVVILPPHDHPRRDRVAAVTPEQDL